MVNVDVERLKVARSTRNLLAASTSFIISSLGVALATAGQSPRRSFFFMQLLQQNCMYVSKCIMHREYTTISTQNCTSAPYSISYITIAVFLAEFAVPLLLVFLRTNSAHACYWAVRWTYHPKARDLRGSPD